MGKINPRSASRPRRRIMVFRLTPEEHKLLEYRVASSDAPSVSDYMRSVVLGPLKSGPSLADLDEKLDRILEILTAPAAGEKANPPRPAIGAKVWQ